MFSLTAEMAKGAELSNPGKVLVSKMPDLSEIVFDHLMDSKLGHVAGAVTRPLRIDVTIDKDDLIKMSRDEFHQACGNQWGQALDATAIVNLGCHLH